MTTAMITASFSGLVRAVGILLSVIISSEFIYFLLFSGSLKENAEINFLNPYRVLLLISGTSYSVKDFSVCNPYRFKNASKPTAHAVGFIFLYPGNYQSSFLRRNVTTWEDMIYGQCTRKLTTCL
jgi:hypothetical protein